MYIYLMILVQGFILSNLYTPECDEQVYVLTTCMLYVGPRFGNQVWNDWRFVSFMKNNIFIG